METFAKRLEITAKDSDMTALRFKERVDAIIAFVAPNATLKKAFPKAAKFMGLGERRVRAIFALEARAIQLADEAAVFEAETRISEHFLTKEMQRHADRLEYAAVRLAANNSEADRERVARYRSLVSGVRRLFNRKAA